MTSPVQGGIRLPKSSFSWRVNQLPSNIALKPERPLMTQSGHQLYRRGIERANFISKASGSLGANIDLFGRIATLAPGKRCETLSPRVNIKERIKVCTDEFFQWRQQYYPTRRSAWLRG
jgi:hypothetical protein